MALEPGAWHGPLLSGFGVHLVYVFEHVQAPTPLLAEVRDAVLEDWQQQQMKTFNEQFYQGLKRRYEVIIEDDALVPGSILQPGQGATNTPGVDS